MSDAKPRRGGREAARSEPAFGDGMPSEAVPVTIAPEASNTSANVLPAAAGLPFSSSGAAAAIEQAAAATVEESVAPAERAVDDAWAVWAQMQAALARGCEEIALEMTAMTRADIAATTNAATAMLDVRTFAEAVEVSAGLIRRRADALIEGSARLSEIGVQAATAASHPILAQLAAGWSGAGRS